MARKHIPGVVLSCLAAAGCGGGERPPRPPPDASARTALALAIGLLEAKDYAGFVERFVPPDELERERCAGRTLDDVADARLADPDQLLARLRQVRGVPPALAGGGTTATFEGSRHGRPVRVVFQKIGGRWYLE